MVHKIRIRSILIIICCWPFFSYGQKQSDTFIIAGNLIDSLAAAPVSYATVKIINLQDSNSRVTYTEEDGSFTADVYKSGIYRIEVSSVGYFNAFATVAIRQEQQQYRLPVIYMKEGNRNLKEVTVVSKKKLVEQKPGMLVYHADQDHGNKGGTAADVLRKAPILNVDAQGNVSMRGSGNIKILINGKYSGQMARSAADALNMMPADMIRSVEIITTPSAKYDAEGAAGVINIITKRGSKNISGSLELAASNREQVVNPRFAIVRERWSVNFNGHLHRLRSRAASELERFATGNNSAALKLNQQVLKDNVAPHGSGDLSIAYTPDSLSEFSLGISTWFGNWPDDNLLNSKVSLPDGTVSDQYKQSITTKAAYIGSDINIGYNRKFKKPGAALTLLAQVSPSKDNSWYNARQTGVKDILLYQEYNNSNTRNREWTFQADYTCPLSANDNYILESGVKSISRKGNNAYTVSAGSQPVPEELEQQPLRSDNFRYRQDVLAGYALLKATLGQGWYAEAGARLEQTSLNGAFAISGSKFTNQFANFVPTATFSKKINEQQSISLSYTKRLTRPYIWDLNPNVNSSDPKNIVSGNPGLQPEIAHQAELTYGVTVSRIFMNSALYWKQTDNAIIDFMQTNADGISRTSKQNLAANRQYGLNLSCSVPVSIAWSMNSNVNINYLDFSSTALSIINTGWAADINVNTSYKLGHNYAIQAFGEYNTRIVTLQGYKTPRYYYSFSVKRDLPIQKLIVTLACINPFTDRISQTELLNTPGFISSRRNHYYNRAVKLTLNWEFGKILEQKERKKISNDDVKGQGKG